MKKILSILFMAISLFSSEVKEEVTINILMYQRGHQY